MRIPEIYKKNLLRYLSLYDPFELTLASIEALAEGKKTQRKKIISTILKAAPKVEPLMCTMRMILKGDCSVEHAANIIKSTRASLTLSIINSLVKEVKKVLVLGLPTVLEQAFMGTDVIVRALMPTLSEIEVTDFLTRASNFFNSTEGSIEHLAQSAKHIAWADVVVLDTFGNWFSSYMREGADQICKLAFNEKPVYLVISRHYQFSQYRFLFGIPLAPELFRFLVTERGVERLAYTLSDTDGYIYNPRWISQGPNSILN